MRALNRQAEAFLSRLSVGFGWLWIAALLLPATAFLVIADQTSRNVNAEARARIARTVDMLHEHAMLSFEAQEGLLDATIQRIRGLGWTEIAQSRDVHEFMNDVVARVPTVLTLGIVAPDGRLVVSSRRAPPLLPRVDLSAREYVQAHHMAESPFMSEHGTYVSDVFETFPTRFIVAVLSRPTLDAEGRPDGGVVSATFSPARFAAFYQRVAEDPNDSVLLLRTDGAVLSRYPLPRSITGMRFPTQHPLTAAMARPGASSGIVEAMGVIEGRQRLYAFRRIDGYPVHVAYGLDMRVIHAALRERLVGPGVVAVLSMLFLLASTAQAQRATTRRLASERARLEAEGKLRQLERVGAFGELAAGVAHDFRNAAQMMESSALLLDRSADHPARVREHAARVGHTATLIATLTNRMLDIVRRQPASNPAGNPARAFDAVQATAELTALLNQTIGHGCRVSIRQGEGRPLLVAADRSEFESALVNLAVNARDAMPQGGEITLSAGSAAPPQVMPSLPALAAGAVRVAVTDRGIGMDEATRARAGEPFFTTKRNGTGTGLGLAGARNFAERCGGCLTIDSRPGAGTTVALWLPIAAARNPEDVEDGDNAEDQAHGPGTVGDRAAALQNNDQQDPPQQGARVPSRQ